MGERLSIATQPTKKKFKSVWLCGMIWFVKRLQSSLEQPTSRPCLDIKNHQDSQFAPLWYRERYQSLCGKGTIETICTKWYNTRYPCLCREQRNSGFRPEKTSGRRHLFFSTRGNSPSYNRMPAAGFICSNIIRRQWNNNMGNCDVVFCYLRNLHSVQVFIGSLVS